MKAQTDASKADNPNEEVTRGALWELLGSFKWHLAVACIIQVIAATASIMPFIAVSKLAAVLLEPGPVIAADAWFWGWIAIASFLIGSLCTFVAGGTTHYIDTDFQLHIRRRLADHLGRVPLGWFSVRHAGSIKKSLADDVMAMHHLVGHGSLDLTSAIVIPLVTFGYLFSVNWAMALVVMLPLMIGLAIYGRQLTLLRGSMATYNANMAGLNNAAIEFVQGISVVKTFGQSGRAYSRFLDSVHRFVEFMREMNGKSMRLALLAEVIMTSVASLVVVMAAGAWLSDMGWVKPIDVIPFALLGLGLSSPLMSLWYASMSAVEARAASGRIRQLLRTRTLQEAQTYPALAHGRLELHNVVFSYDGRHRALDGITLALEPGTTTALVGRSGSGKSTVAKLIPRFWDPTNGRIMLGGVDLRDIPSRELYRYVSFVFQDVQLLQTSVLENIRLGRPNASITEVEEAAKLAQIHTRIVELPRGYESVYGEDALFSGGEMQRVSIARALLADTPILVLDEATAFADPESEALIQDALSILAVGRTLLVIAHRLSTIQQADQILVLDNGRIVERGRHPQLVAQQGLYYKLWENHERSAQWNPRTASGKEYSK